ncbi:MAG: hypothetical protein HYY35_06365 [Deltaproteobacteria bacterium]|nr:hypothetical protein [Deltaproteobacteria bacterium]
MSVGGKGIFAFTATAITAASMIAGCSRPLPEEGSPDAALYRARCGTCHSAVSPRVVKPPTWQMIMPRMVERMRAAGQPLGKQERAAIESYLERNGG